MIKKIKSFLQNRKEKAKLKKIEDLKKEILINQKLKNIQNDLSLIKLQINNIIKFLKEKK